MRDFILTVLFQLTILLLLVGFDLYIVIFQKPDSWWWITAFVSSLILTWKVAYYLFYYVFGKIAEFLSILFPPDGTPQSSFFESQLK